jgi:hypothetical protein
MEEGEDNSKMGKKMKKIKIIIQNLKNIHKIPVQ